MPKQTTHPDVWLSEVDRRGVKKWQLSYVDPDTGKRKRPTIGDVGTMPRSQAVREAERVSMRLRVRRDRPGVSFEAAFDAWLDDREADLRPDTIAHYRKHVRVVLGELPLPHSVTLVQPADLAMCRSAIARMPQSVKTRNNRLGAIRAGLTWMRRRGMTPEVSGADIRDQLYPIPADAVRPKFHSTDELVRVLEGVRARDEAEHGQRIGHAVVVLLLTGMRLGEFCGLTWDAVDFEANRIDLTRTKTRRPRWIDLDVSPSVRAILERMERLGPYVWAGHEPICPKRVSAWFWRLKEYRGIPTSGPQMLRRTCSTFLTAMVGFDRSAVRMGHTVEVAQRRYVGLVKLRGNPATLEEAMFSG